MVKLGLNPLYSAQKQFVIGDIQGMGSQLERLLGVITPLMSKTDHIVFVGDLLDHGKEPFKVLELIKQLKISLPNQVFIIEGNHEVMMKEFLLRKIPNHRPYSSWPQHGGRINLDQFREKYIDSQIDSKLELEAIVDGLKRDGYWEFYENLIPYYESEKVVITHAPIDETMVRLYSSIDNVKDKSIENLQLSLNGVLDRMKQELLWKFSTEKRFFLDLGKQLVCGHQSQHHKRPRLFKDRVYLDAGTGAKENRELFAVEMPSKKIYSSS